jgi:hypothetical protein
MNGVIWVFPVPSGCTVNHPSFASLATSRLPSGDHTGGVDETVTRRGSLPSAAATQISLTSADIDPCR